MLNNELIKKVHIVFMTHFDMGFTDLAENVLSRYKKEFVPQAIELAREMNRGGEKRFVWTLDAFLIDYYLKEAETKAARELSDAIDRGDIGWHGMALTTHTELMDADLMRFNLGYAKELDRRFGKKTITANLTDVPGHTKAIVKCLEEQGIRYLHIGVNPSSMNPEVPSTFVWKSGESELLVQYSPVYGSVCYVDGMEEVLEFIFLGDNQGIPSKTGVEEALERLQTVYPNARIEAAGLEEYAQELLKYKEQLPVITEEIGDSWIHGIASDPCKVMHLKRLMALKNRWKQEGLFGETDPAYARFMEGLLMVCEHTWALDYKKYLFDFTNWEKEDFQNARKKDSVTDALFGERNRALRESICAEKGLNHLEGTYSFYESSYAEQRQYLEMAVRALPKERQQEAKTALRQVETLAQPQNDGGQLIALFETVEIGDWTVAFDGGGTMISLEKGGKEWVRNGGFGRLSYETYSACDTASEYYQYNHAFRENMIWSEADFSKPGMEAVEGLEHRNYGFGVRNILRKGRALELELEGNGKAVRQYGCPAKALLRYTFGEDTVICDLVWKQKDANKMPEALWFDIKLDVENPCLWDMVIMGEKISPLHVVKGGNRRQHCVERLCYDGADGSVEICNLDSPLVSVGGRRLFGDCLELPDMKQGFSFCLFNNKWGTNFPMWCEDDGYFQYIIKLKNK